MHRTVCSGKSLTSSGNSQEKLWKTDECVELEDNQSCQGYGGGWETTTQQDTRITTGHIKDIQYIIHLLLCWKSSVLTLMDVTKLQSNMVQIPMPTPKYIINFHAEFHLLSYRNRQCSGIINAKYLVLLSWGYFLAIPQKKIKQISSVKLKICACYLGTSTERQQL